MTEEIFSWELIGKALKLPFPVEVIHWRPGTMTKDKSKAMALAYVDARDVMDRLDEVVGPFNWQRLHDTSHQICKLGIRFPETTEWVWKSDVSGDTNIEAEKGGASRAFVRAAVNWGIGRYLYDLPSPWIEINEWKRFSDESIKKLNDRLQKWQDRRFG